MRRGSVMRRFADDDATRGRWVQPDVHADTQRLLTALDGEQLTMKQLRERGVRRPGEVIYELQLNGVDVERRHTSDGVVYRLLAPVSDPSHHAP